jgi:galactonate dehydratase
MTRSRSRRDFFVTSAAAGAGLMLPGLLRLAEAGEQSAPWSRPSDLKITNVRCGYIRGGNGLFVKIHTDQGIWGCGEGVDATAGTYHLVQRFGRWLEGKNPLNVHRL